MHDGYSFETKNNMHTFLPVQWIDQDSYKKHMLFFFPDGITSEKIVTGVAQEKRGERILQPFKQCAQGWKGPYHILYHSQKSIQ